METEIPFILSKKYITVIMEWSTKLASPHAITREAPLPEPATNNTRGNQNSNDEQSAFRIPQSSIRHSQYPLVVIAGPTASGKSGLGIELARRFHGEIISCDALQVYRHMDIGTAKPTAAEQNAVPHHMLNLREPGEDFSAGDYQRLARQVLHDIRGRSEIPFVIGGTGFYLRALFEGFFEGPGRSEFLRERMMRVVERRGAQSLHTALARVDPISAARIAAGDRGRIIRAYEVYLLTGRPISWWHQQPASALTGFRWLMLAISWPRAELYDRINQRVTDMIAAGFEDEVRGLMLQYPRNCHAFKAIGYRQIASYLDGQWTREEAIEDTKQESRRYAKRQLTWFRSMSQIRWLNANQPWGELVESAAGQIREFLI